MNLFFRLSTYTIPCFLLLMTVGYPLKAEEPDMPLPSAAVDSLQTLLRRSQPDTNRVNLLLLLCEHYLNDFKHLYDHKKQIEQYLKEIETINTALHYAEGRVRHLHMKGRLLVITGQGPAAKIPFEKSIALCQKMGYRHLEAENWLYYSATFPWDEAGYPGKNRCLQRARVLYQQTHDRRKEAYILKFNADVNLWEGKPAESLNKLLQALAIYRSIGYRKLHYTYDLMGSVYRSMGFYKEALSYGLLALDNAKACADTSAIDYFHWKLGVSYLDLTQLDESNQYFRIGLERAKTLKNTFDVWRATGYLCKNLIAQNKPEQALRFFRQIQKEFPPADDLYKGIAGEIGGDCYLALRQYARAETYYQEMLRVREKSDQANVYLALGNLYIATRQYEQARDFLNKALRFTYQVGETSLKTAQVHLMMFKVDSAQGKFPMAIRHYQRYKALNDSVFNQTRSQQIASLNLQYKTAKKEQEIKLLQKDKSLSQARIRSAQTTRNVTVAGAVLLAGLLGMIYNRYRLKQRSNQQLEAKQLLIDQKNESLQQLLEEREWMLKEIHHRVKNNLQVISSMLNAQFDFLKDSTALSAIRESQNRVQVMALIHQKLYQSDNLARIDMQQYIHEIVDYLIESFDREHTVRTRCEIAPLELDVSLATPLGLIINEAVTNSLKYAFPENRPGTVAVRLSSGEGQRYQLVISDDGVGLPAGFDATRSNTLGLTMIRGLSKQIRGTLDITQCNGLEISLQFDLVKKTAKTAQQSAHI
ncbi:tetratricopeptide repeat-containing sensor histidine kinase [Larkinella sp. VNQ87]|uniref:tetratricopeptide repeat-containing sensor histidine kinase n=1 Tax=Larkinella sp. VNQ87 TaxID=3400921 RepID=UPI003C0D5D04